MKDYSVYKLHLNDDVTLTEISVPTCSYRMGVPRMGYGYALIGQYTSQYMAFHNQAPIVEGGGGLILYLFHVLVVLVLVRISVKTWKQFQKQILCEFSFYDLGKGSSEQYTVRVSQIRGPQLLLQQQRWAVPDGPGSAPIPIPPWHSDSDSDSDSNLK